MLAAPRERRVIGGGEVDAQHPEDRGQKTLRLAEWKVEEEPKRQRGVDGRVGVLQLPATLADAHGRPRGDRIRGEPHGHAASLDERAVVRRPVTNAVSRLVPRMHSRLHVEIMRLRPSRWLGLDGSSPERCIRAPTPCRSVSVRLVVGDLFMSEPPHTCVSTMCPGRSDTPTPLCGRLGTSRGWYFIDFNARRVGPEPRTQELTPGIVLHA